MPQRHGHAGGHESQRALLRRADDQADRLRRDLQPGNRDAPGRVRLDVALGRAEGPIQSQAEPAVSGAVGDSHRIPSLLVAPNGDLLAVCEGRKDGGGLKGKIDIVL